MSLGSYNRTGFNTGPVDSGQNVAAYSMFATFSAAFAIGAIFSPSYFCAQSLDAVMDIGWGYNIPYAFETSFDAWMEADSLATPSYDFNAALELDARLSAAWIVSYEMASALDAEMVMRYAIFPRYGVVTELDTEMIGYIAILPRYGALYQSLTALFSMVPIRTVTMILDVEIPPGGRLIVNSDLYTVYLNNENAIHAYQGDWIKLSRPLLGLEVEGGTSGDLDVTVLYRELFL